jgi:hypothetical protein
VVVLSDTESGIEQRYNLRIVIPSEPKSIGEAAAVRASIPPDDSHEYARHDLASQETHNRCL